jgi:hypothetical protein
VQRPVQREVAPGGCQLDKLRPTRASLEGWSWLDAARVNAAPARRTSPRERLSRAECASASACSRSRSPDSRWRRVVWLTLNARYALASDSGRPASILDRRGDYMPRGGEFMSCEACHGCGTVSVTPRKQSPGMQSVGGALRVSTVGSAIELTCSECNGSGITHCCDGICAQPQTELS